MSENNDAWLGLLKWSLNYVDGTVPSAESPGYNQMSAEDRAFLEEVMKNGIIDEGERMKTILSSLVEYLDSILRVEEVSKVNDDDSQNADEIIELLEELQGIVEQIDFAKSFAAMGGIKFLIGCSGERRRVPRNIRQHCLTILSTLCQNNPAVQLMMLEQGSIAKLVELYFSEFPEHPVQTKQDKSLRTKIMQCLASSVRNHDIAEKIFCMNVEGVRMIESGLGLYSADETLPNPCRNLRIKTLFFLQALVTSDLSDHERIKLFGKSIRFAAGTFLDPKIEKDQEIREMTLSMIVRLIDNKLLEDCIEDLQSSIAEHGETRMEEVIKLDEEEQHYMKEESALWKSLMASIGGKTS